MPVRVLITRRGSLNGFLLDIFHHFASGEPDSSTGAIDIYGEDADGTPTAVELVGDVGGTNNALALGRE